MNITKAISYRILQIFLFIIVVGCNINCAVRGKQTMLLPVNVTAHKGKRLNLAIDIPHGFRALPQPANSTIQEFIPLTDHDDNAWSQIITSQVFIGRNINAPEQISLLKERFMQRSDTAGDLIAESAYEYGNYAMATIIIAYTNPLQGRREVMLARYYSGSYDCSGFQYTIALTEDMTQAMAIQQLTAFADTKTSLIKF